MIQESVQKRLEQYKDIYIQLRKELRWQVSDQRTLMIAASIYINSSKEFDLNRYIGICDTIKKQAKLFSPLNSYQRFTIAAVLDVRYSSPEEKFKVLTELYEEMIKAGLNRGMFTYIAALMVIDLKADSPGTEELVNRIKAVYKGMRARHKFLTSNSDYPLAALLAAREETIEELMEETDFYYTSLSKQGFKKGNDLQYLSHVLSLASDRKREDLAKQCIQLLEKLKESGYKAKSMNYPALGLLSLTEDPPGEVPHVLEAMDSLNSEKLFKWYKDMNFMVAVSSIAGGQAGGLNIPETGILTASEIIIQMQQAAMIAAFAGTAAAASSGGGEG